MIYSLYNHSISILLISLSFALSLFILKKNNENLLIGILICLWHLLFVFVHYYYSLFFDYASDSYTYFHSSLSQTYEIWYSYSLLDVGSNFLKNFVYIFHAFLNFSYFNVFLIFSILGNLGLIYLYIILIKKIKKKYSVLILSLILLPSLSFWTSGIYKDVIVFFGIVFFLWNLIKEKNINIYGTILSIFVIFLVRPYIAIILLLSFFCGLIFKTQKNLFDYFYIFLSVMVMPLLYLQFKKIYGFEFDFSSFILFFDSIFGIIEYRQGLDVNSSLSIEDMNFAVKYFTYFFRPLPYEANNLFQLFISFENLYLLFVTIIIFFITFKSFSKNIKKNFNYKIAIIFFYVVITSYVLAYTTTNFGVSSRQKFMVLPYIFFLVTYFFSNNKLELNAK